MLVFRKIYQRLSMHWFNYIGIAIGRTEIEWLSIPNWKRFNFQLWISVHFLAILGVHALTTWCEFLSLTCHVWSQFFSSQLSHSNDKFHHTELIVINLKPQNSYLSHISAPNAFESMIFLNIPSLKAAYCWRILCSIREKLSKASKWRCFSD